METAGLQLPDTEPSFAKLVYGSKSPSVITVAAIPTPVVIARSEMPTESHPVASIVTEATPTIEDVTNETAGAPTNDPLVEFLTNVIVEQTGYPREIIEFDWDLEADLGIDSIRKAMILGELREFFDIESELDRNVFQDLRTLRDVLELLRRSTGKGEWLQPAKKNAADQVEISQKTVSSDEDSEPEDLPVVQHQASISHPELADFLIDFVVERTGYPRDIIELDADLESDLGIDSIAKAQLVGEVRDHFHLTIEDSSLRAALGDMRTLRQLQDLVERETGTASAAPQAAANGAGASEFNKNRPAERPAAHDKAEVQTPVYSAPQSPRTIDFPKPKPVNPEYATAFNTGHEWGLQHKTVLQNRLFDNADQAGLAFEVPTTATITVDDQISPLESAELRGVAAGADVHPQNVISVRDHLKQPLNGAALFNGSSNGHHNGELHDLDNANVDQRADSFTQRFRLEMSPAETRKWSGVRPDFAGGAIVVGDDSECAELVKRLESFCITV
jgi:acyl carrier protein